MKKTLLFIAVIIAAMFTNAQGTWKAVGTEASVAAGTEMTLGIPNLKAVPSDAAGVVGKTDSGAPTTTYNGISWDSQAIVQGSTNGMYFAFLPSKSGTFDIAIKMGSAKKTFFLELKNEAYTSISATVGDLAALAAGYPTADGIAAANFTTPSVYDTYHATNGTWDGTTNFQSTGANVYFAASFPVTANKTYVIGCYGSKLMLRGVSLATTTNVGKIPASDFRVYPNPANGRVFIDVNEPTNIGIYNLVGNLVAEKTISTSGEFIDVRNFVPGMYFVRSTTTQGITQKLIIK
jgi:hypothetical protein